MTLTPTAYLFRRGHRIRVQVSSGAFPLYNRKPRHRATSPDRHRDARRGPAGAPRTRPSLAVILPVRTAR
ncbi:CocE/NonD family hydrolase C-terminal non-catalytic domain-containing protein [Nonomuraea montanisoli]|uniref:CocE/NonD family hydrolase C-terminal non-catalytic domain-containing protein n=1 Tax=Nonomuraea montanisoli TaxID=2741721 RepID=UPI0019660F16